MVASSRRARTSSNRRRQRMVFRPQSDGLEQRMLMTADLANIDDPDAPLGVQFASAGTVSAQGAGFSAAVIGDVNGDSFEDFLIGAPGVDVSGGDPALGTLIESRAYLVFGSTFFDSLLGPGSQFVEADFLDLVIGDIVVDGVTLTVNERGGNLDTLRSGDAVARQTNPFTGGLGFNFAGVEFVLSASAPMPVDPTTANLGASVAGVDDINGDGFGEILIGAPGVNGGSGQAYLIYGGPELERDSTLLPEVALNDPATFNGLDVVTFTTDLIGASLGSSVAELGNVLGQGTSSLALGAAGASLGGRVANGAVFVASAAPLSVPDTQTIDVGLIGQTAVSPADGLVLIGPSSGQEAGFSVAGVGNFDGDVIGGSEQFDILIGGPATGGGPNPEAYLVLGGSDLLDAAVDVGGGFLAVDLADLGGDPGEVPGITFAGFVGDGTGFSVAGVGNFNEDLFSDILIGSPTADSPIGGVITPEAGVTTLIYGRPLPATDAAGLTVDVVNALVPEPQFPSARFFGTNLSDLAGFSVGGSRRTRLDIPTDVTEILIGAPGAVLDSGEAYLVPGTRYLFGEFSLTAGELEAERVAGDNLINTELTGDAFLGTSVAGRPLQLGGSAATITVDGDTLGDFLIGASGDVFDPSIPDRGGAFLVEGGLLLRGGPNRTPAALTVTVDSIDDVTDEVELLIGSSVSNLGALDPDSAAFFSVFDPSLDIPDTSVFVIDEVFFLNASFVETVPDFDGDGIDDARFLVFNDQGASFAGSFLLEGIAELDVVLGLNSEFAFTNGGDGGGGPVDPPPIPPGDVAAGFVVSASPSGFALPFGERLTPDITAFNGLQWRPIPFGVAINPFLPQVGFLARTRFDIGNPIPNQRFGSLEDNTQFRTSTLGANVFHRGRFEPGFHPSFDPIPANFVPRQPRFFFRGLR